MKFNSQICTTREQSERLLALGLRKETADMVWRYSNTVKGKDYYDPEAQPYDCPEQKSRWIESCEKADYLSHWFKPDGTPMTVEEVYEAVWGKDIPAWSLHRLWELLGKIKKYEGEDELLYPRISLEEDDVIVVSPKSLWSRRNFCSPKGAYENIINCFEELIEEGYFNKEYLV